MDHNNNSIARKSGKRENRAAITRPVQDALGERLRSMYGHLRAEPVPDRLLDLLKQVDEHRPSDR
jgi:hypothetical protein